MAHVHVVVAQFDYITLNAQKIALCGSRYTYVHGTVASCHACTYVGSEKDGFHGLRDVKAT